jgi:hypothetical protein
MSEIDISSIAQLRRLAEEAGDQADPVTGPWTKVDTVYFMSRPMPLIVRQRAAQLPDLKYYSASVTPHNRADEGFVDHAKSEAISFPTSA